MATDFVFVYGANMSRSELRSWLEGSGHDSSLVLSATIATLSGYDYVWNYYSRGRGCGTANLEPKENSTVWGILLEIDESLLKEFDRKEGHPYFYSRGTKRVPVKTISNGQTLQAWLYLAESNKTAGKDVRPSREYKGLLVSAAEYWGFPEEYVERMRQWDTQ